MGSVLNDTLSGAQRGLLLRPIFGKILTIKLKRKDEAHDAMVEIIQGLDKEIQANHADDSAFVAAFAPDLWGAWTKRDIKISTKVLDEGYNFKHTPADALLYIKTPDNETASEIVATFIRKLEPLIGEIQEIDLGKRRDGRVVGGRYVDHISNPNDPISLAEDVLVPGPGIERGATFAFTQQFIFDWPDIATQSGSTLDSVIGRRPDGEIISTQAFQGNNAHIRRAHTLDHNLDQRKLLRQALPYGDSKGHASREEGLMFVAFCNEQQRFEDILQNMVGERPERPADRLMDFVQGMGGSYWYVPSATELGVSGVRNGDDTYEDPHWKVRSTNGYLFYNSQDYMHQMAEGKYVVDDHPSVRVLSLLSRTFNHWRDGWMKTENFPRLPHLKDLLAEKKQQVPESIMERKGLANMITLDSLLSSPDSPIALKTGLVRIASNELIVGAIPDFTLGRGKEVVPYLTDDETMAAFLKAALNEWSAMGHVVPNMQTVVDKGIKGLVDDFDARATKAKEAGESEKASFYISARDSFKGVQGYLRNWARIAEKAASNATEKHRKENMLDVQKRMNRLAEEKPASFQDAVQLIFSVHSCLHLVGELTAFGRLDQILWPFLEKDNISDEFAQDIIDCLWIKIGENAFVNRAFIYDYRTYGTTSINGLGSNFPQGGGSKYPSRTYLSFA